GRSDPCTGNWWQTPAPPSTQLAPRSAEKSPIAAWPRPCERRRGRAPPSGGLGGRINHPFNFGDLGGREAAQVRVLANDRLVLGEVDAKRLVVGEVAFDPLDVGSQLMQDLIGLGCSAAQLLALQAADLGNIAFDDEFAQSHNRFSTTHLRPAAGQPCG